MQIDPLNITLRRARLSDTEFVSEMRTQPTSRRFQASPVRTLDQIRGILNETVDAPLTNPSVGRFYWIAEYEQRPIGMIQVALFSTDRTQNDATLGYTVAETFQGRGVATAMTSQIIPIAFDRAGLALGRLEAVAAVGNVASRRVLEKCDFQFEGIQRGLLVIGGERVDHACYALLESDDIARGSS